MTGFTTATPNLIRTDVWSNQIKEVILDDLIGTKYVKMISDFPDGNTFHIPSIGKVQMDDYTENTEIGTRALNTGDFEFSWTDYKAAGTFVTDKEKQDSMYIAQIISSYPARASRSLMENIETSVMALGNSQTLNNVNVINGADHRFVGSGTSEVIALADFAKARYALKKAGITDNLVAIVDPSVEYALSTLANLVSVSNNPKWEGIVNKGMSTGMQFVMNVYGFDVYTSNYLADANETIDGKTTAAGKCNLFFSASPEAVPFIGGIKQMPNVEMVRRPEFQRDEYYLTARYGFKLYRPEGLVCILTDTDQV